MMWNRLSIGKKMFIAIMATVIVVIAFVAIMIVMSIRTGFYNYILRAELDRFEPMIEVLAQRHDPENPGWPDLSGDQRQIRDLIFQTIMPRGAQRDAPRGVQRGAPRDAQREPPPRNAEQLPRQGSQNNQGDESAANRPRPQNGGNRPPRRDPLNLANRFALLDAQKNIISGTHIAQHDMVTREIIGADVNGNQSLIGYIALSRPTRNQRANLDVSTQLFLTDQLRTLLLTLVVALIVSMFAAYLLSRQFTQPVARLVAGTKRMTSGDYGVRLDKTSEDEFGNLVEQFNQLAAKLNAQDISERQWLSDTSHELQTPIAVLKAEIEAIQDGVREANDNTLATLHQSVTRLSALVKDISQLSHAREGRLLSSFKKDDLSALAYDAIGKARGQMNDAGLELECNLAAQAELECDPMRIGQLIDNLLSNSRRYTQAPGTVRVSTKDLGQEVVLTVEDSNSPPSSEAMDKLFDRFYRADQSRSRKGDKTDGSGLGLSICKLIAQAHQGSIKAELSPLGGLAMIVKIPKVRKNADE